MDDLLTGFFNEVSQTEKDTKKAVNKDKKKDVELDLLDNFFSEVSKAEKDVLTINQISSTSSYANNVEKSGSTTSSVKRRREEDNHSNVTGKDKEQQQRKKKQIVASVTSVIATNAQTHNILSNSTTSSSSFSSTSNSGAPDRKEKVSTSFSSSSSSSLSSSNNTNGHIVVNNNASNNNSYDGKSKSMSWSQFKAFQTNAPSSLASSSSSISSAIAAATTTAEHTTTHLHSSLHKPKTIDSITNNNNSNSNRNKFVRVGGGEKWVDASLADWPENDFRLFIGDLGEDVSEKHLDECFQCYPSYAMSKVVRTKWDNKSKGYGFVSFLDPLDCAKALREKNGKWLGQRPMKISKSQWNKRNLSTVKAKEKNKKEQLKQWGLYS